MSAHTNTQTNHTAEPPGKDLEQRLNTDYSPSTPHHQDFRTYIHQGLQKGWVATTPLDGDRYRRGKIAPPPAARRRASSASRPSVRTSTRASTTRIPTARDQLRRPDRSDGPAQGLAGGAGTDHYPQVRGGALVALFLFARGRYLVCAGSGGAAVALCLGLMC